MSDQSIQEVMDAHSVRPAADYAAAITSVTDDIITTIASCTDEHWLRVSAAEQWPAAVVAHHAGAVMKAFAVMLAAIETGAPVPQFTMEDVHRNYARHAEEFAGVSKEETQAFIQTNATALINATNPLPEARLTEVAGTFRDFKLTVAQLLEFAVVAHLNEHLTSIRTTIAK